MEKNKSEKKQEVQSFLLMRKNDSKNIFVQVRSIDSGVGNTIDVYA